MEQRLYGRFTVKSETMIFTARLTKLCTGRFAFETSTLGKRPYELNMNMPLFDSENKAYKWIESQHGKKFKWKRLI